MRSLVTALCLVSAPLYAQEAPRVVADIAPIRALVAQVMDGVGSPSLLIPLSASPHSYAMRPSEARALREADLVVWVGPGLSHWLEEPLDTLSADAERLTLMAHPGTQNLPMREVQVMGAGDDHDHDHDHKDEHDHKEDHSDGHGHAHHGDVDPHGWLSPANAVLWAGAVAQKLGQLDPANAERYMANWTVLSDEVRAAEQDIKAQLAPVRDKSFMVLHDGTQYFEVVFGMQAEAFIVPGDGRAPGPATLRAIQTHLAEHPVACAFTAPQENTALLRTATEGQNTRIATLNSFGDGEETYAVTLRRMGQELFDCLSAE